jgi:hypothetical protein
VRRYQVPQRVSYEQAQQALTTFLSTHEYCAECAQLGPTERDLPGAFAVLDGLGQAWPGRLGSSASAAVTMPDTFRKKRARRAS